MFGWDGLRNDGWIGCSCVCVGFFLFFGMLIWLHEKLDFGPDKNSRGEEAKENASSSSGSKYNNK